MRLFSTLVLVCCFAAGALTAQPVEYEIRRTPGRIVIDAKLDEPAWTAAEPVGDFHFNWYESGDKEQTIAKLLWDDDNLYVSWRARDRHISAYERKRHGPVSKDDCVELFLAPNPAKIRNYYTFEINAIGTMLNRNRSDWWTGGPTWEPEGMEYRTSFHGLEKKDESPDDREWIVEAAIPLRNFSRDAAHIPPRDGDEWRLNLQRLGGKTNPQPTSWSPIPAPAKSFHTPEAFAKVVFLAQAATGQGSSGNRRPKPNPEDARAGREIYNRSCTMCHGLDGANGDRAPALGAQRRYIRSTSEELFDAIKNGIKGTNMPASPMKEADVNKIVAFIHSLRATAIDVEVAGNAAQGESIFHGKGGCSNCHMIRGRGGLLGPDLSNIGAERKLDDLRLALTTPKSVPPRGFQPVTIITTAGAKIEGIAKNEHNTSIQVLGRDNKLHLLTRDEIRKIDYGTRSFMPADADKRLTREEFQNLLAFVARQAKRRQQ